MADFLRTLWMRLLEAAIARLTAADWDYVQRVVLQLMASTHPSEEKRRIALSLLREAGSTAATWLLNAAIEIAYGRIQRQLDLLDE